LDEELPKMQTREAQEAVLSLLNELWLGLERLILLIEDALKNGKPVKEDVVIEGTLFKLWYERERLPVYSREHSRKTSSGLPRWAWLLLGVWLGFSLDD
jgi:hypothetical protein